MRGKTGNKFKNGIEDAALGLICVGKNIKPCM
jgi:hypothetical protein